MSTGPLNTSGGRVRPAQLRGSDSVDGMPVYDCAPSLMGDRIAATTERQAPTMADMRADTARMLDMQDQLSDLKLTLAQKNMAMKAQQQSLLSRVTAGRDPRVQLLKQEVAALESELARLEEEIAQLTRPADSNPIDGDDGDSEDGPTPIDGDDDADSGDEGNGVDDPPVDSGGSNPVDPRPIVPKGNDGSVDPVPVDPNKPPQPVKGGGGTSDRDTKLNQLRSQLTPAALASLDQLGSKLDDRDLKTGKTLLDTLSEFATKGIDDELVQHGLTNGAVLSDLVQELADPGIIHQADHGTCAATTIQYMMAKNHPAEYARLIGGLMNGGSVDMASGQPLARDASSLDQDRGDRNEIDRIFQTAAMERSEMGHYDNRTDRHDNGAQGLTQQDETRLANDLTGGREGSYRTAYGSDSGVIAAIKQATSAGHDVPVGLRWSVGGRDAGHELLVTKIEGDRVYLRNPWGKDEHGQPYLGPNRQALDGEGNIVMSLDDFRQCLASSSIAV